MNQDQNHFTPREFSARYLRSGQRNPQKSEAACCGPPGKAAGQTRVAASSGTRARFESKSSASTSVSNRHEC